jgi:translation initiation factor IF-2
LVSVVVKSGKILAGDNLFAGDKPVKIKGIFDWQGKPVKEVVAGEPALLMGFAELPEVGVVLSQQKREVGQKIVQKIQTENLKKTKLTLSLKAKTKGALEALKASLPKEVTVITAEVGEVYESDVLTAKASKARIFAFEAKVSPSVANLADAEGVVIEKFSVIYELLDRIEEILTQGEMKIKGKAEIIATFPFNSQKIAGCKVSQGIITKIDKLLLFRQEKEIGKVKAVSLQKQKQEIKEAKAGEEFGVLFEPQLDFKVGDVLVSLANGK